MKKILEDSTIYYQKDFIFNENGLSINFSEKKASQTILKIIFHKPIESHSITHKKPPQTPLKKEAFFTSKTESSYLEWLLEESLESIESQIKYHFHIITQTTIIDVISAYEPTIQYII
jgi:hypothetical protein